jgi:hypothetical protein
MNCASFLKEKVFNKYTKFSKIKIQIAHNEQFVFLPTSKSFPFWKSCQQVKLFISAILALQRLIPLSSTC